MNRTAVTPLSLGELTDVDHILVGHFHRFSRGWRTGSTAIIFPSGAIAGVDVRGGGPGTRETDALTPENLIQRIHGLCFSGGSAFGLSTADGVMEHLYRQGIGFPVGSDSSWVVPIVPAAVIFDLGRGGNIDNRPTAQFGLRAARSARSSNAGQGSIGAGIGARSGGLQGGIGMASLLTESGIRVSALAVVNSIGSIIDPDTCLPWIVPTSSTTGKSLLHTPSRSDRLQLRDYLVSTSRLTSSAESGSLNTTIGVVATDAPLTKTECTKLAGVAHDGLARAIRPAHSMHDGDTIFAVSLGSRGEALPVGPEGLVDHSSRAANLNPVLSAGADAFALACSHAILCATRRNGPPSYLDLCPSAVSSRH